ncbi:hypothetical protein [Massilia horti]|uniref:Lipocalin-like domain-containing protein n=1 Tax=Massilia horti TaxID=2562153 RepID=A0A4Y9T144_9BURK|nr:hypothetical protein [Massilia horti]TFW33144.1 hypothetical protein E4O92_07740 [Massilia horti]
MGYSHCPALRQRLRSFPSVAAITLAAWSPLPSQAAQPGHEVIGKWKFVSALDFTVPSSLDEQEAQQLLGHVLTISKNWSRFDDGQDCGVPGFETKRVEPSLYLQREAGIGASKLKLPNPVTVVDINCTQVFVKKPNRVVIFWEGFFFEAVRVSR